MDAYLDIETSFENEITIVGIYREDNGLKQLIGKEITKEKLMESFKGVKTIFTYNGDRFDLLFIKEKIGIDLKKIFNCHDLMYDCWVRNLYGGLKGVEKRLKIKRKFSGINGIQAMNLWDRYKKDNDQETLEILLSYNQDDVLNLKIIKEKIL